MGCNQRLDSQRSVKYEEVAPHAYDSVAEARVRISRTLGFYNSKRPPQALTPTRRTEPILR